MKTTRRTLLTMLGLGAAAAALAPVKADAAEMVQCHQCSPDSPFPHVYGHPDGDVMLSPFSTLVLRDGHIVDSATGLNVEEFTARKVAQVRADGYNRGRAVEMARQEAVLERFRNLPVTVERMPQSALGGVISNLQDMGIVVKD